MKIKEERLQLEEWIVMPNHVHLIIGIMDRKGDNGDVYVAEKIHKFSLP